MGKPIASGVVHIDLNDSSTSNVTLGTYSLNSTHEYRRQLRMLNYYLMNVQCPILCHRLCGVIVEDWMSFVKVEEGN